MTTPTATQVSNARGALFDILDRADSLDGIQRDYGDPVLDRKNENFWVGGSNRVNGFASIGRQRTEENFTLTIYVYVERAGAAKARECAERCIEIANLIEVELAQHITLNNTVYSALVIASKDEPYATDEGHADLAEITVTCKARNTVN